MIIINFILFYFQKTLLTNELNNLAKTIDELKSNEENLQSDLMSLRKYLGDLKKENEELISSLDMFKTESSQLRNSLLQMKKVNFDLSFTNLSRINYLTLIIFFC